MGMKMSRAAHRLAGEEDRCRIRVVGDVYGCLSAAWEDSKLVGRTLEGLLGFRISEGLLEALGRFEFEHRLDAVGSVGAQAAFSQGASDLRD
jgi:hypothetical protein